MEAKDVILMSLEQSRECLTKVLDGLSQEEAAWSPRPECNSIAFILWHMTRWEDFPVNRIIQGQPQLYEMEGWREKPGTPPKETGYQYSVEQLQAWPVPDLNVLRGYANSVRGKTLAFLKSIPAEKLSDIRFKLTWCCVEISA